MRRPGERFRATAVVVVLSVLLAGCGAASAPTSGASAPEPTPSAAAASVPADGVPLSAFGVTNGPAGAFSLPRTAVLTSVVDQPNAVSLVISRPAAGELYGYLQRSLPAAGFTITDSAAEVGTLTFEGRGWQGSFTSDTRASAILLRPA